MSQRRCSDAQVHCADADSHPAQPLEFGLGCLIVIDQRSSSTQSENCQQKAIASNSSRAWKLAGEISHPSPQRFLDSNGADRDVSDLGLQTWFKNQVALFVLSQVVGIHQPADHGSSASRYCSST